MARKRRAGGCLAASRGGSSSGPPSLREGVASLVQLQTEGLVGQHSTAAWLWKDFRSFLSAAWATGQSSYPIGQSTAKVPVFKSETPSEEFLCVLLCVDPFCFIPPFVQGAQKDSRMPGFPAT